MEHNILFSERQKFNQWWLWLLIIGLNGFFIFGIVKQALGQQQYDKLLSFNELTVAESLVLLLTILILNFRLDTQIKDDGIYVRFFPLHIKFQFYSWDSILKLYIRHYSAITEYGGWGIRFSLFGKGKAYIISGKNGLQLEFMNNKKLLIGTNKTEELSKILESMNRLKP